MTSSEAITLARRLSDHVGPPFRAEMAYTWGRGTCVVIAYTDAGPLTFDDPINLRIFARLRTGRGLDETR